jgi:thiol-disulfide isomerase/thioredoxin
MIEGQALSKRAASWIVLAGALLGGAMAANVAAETTLAKAADLAADVRESARTGIPVLLLFSLPGCPHCEAIRRGHLLALEKEQPARVIARQVDMHSTQVMIDFAGRRTTHGEFIRAQNIRFAPIVVLAGAGGERLTEPLVGAMLPDFYGAYLEGAIAAATRHLRASSDPVPKS